MCDETLKKLLELDLRAQKEVVLGKHAAAEAEAKIRVKAFAAGVELIVKDIFAEGSSKAVAGEETKTAEAAGVRFSSGDLVRVKGQEKEIYRVEEIAQDKICIRNIYWHENRFQVTGKDLCPAILLPGEAEEPDAKKEARLAEEISLLKLELRSVHRDLELGRERLRQLRRKRHAERRDLGAELTFTQKELDAVRRERSAQARELEALRQQTPLTAEIEEKLKQASWLFEKAQAELEEERAWTKLARKERDLARVREQEARAELGRLQDDSRRGEDDYLFPPVRRFARALHAAVEKAAEVSRPLGLGESEARLVQRVGRLLAERPANAAEAVPDMVIDIAVTCLDLYDAIQERISRSAQGSP